MAISYLQNNQTRELFLKRRKAFIRLISNLGLALSLMCLDHFHRIDAVRYYLNDVSSSIHVASQMPSQWVESVLNYFSEQDLILEKNRLLSEQVLHLQAELHSMQAQNYHQAQIKDWMRSQDLSLKVANTASMMSIEVNANRHIYILNKGLKDGIFEGQVAIDGKGVIGQIIDVGRYTSTLLLISDLKCAVPIMNQRTGEHSILAGLNKLDELQLLNVSKTSLIRSGDVLYTSGLGMVYPFGIPVAVVKEVRNQPGEDFLKVTAQPLADLHKNHMVMLIESFKNIEIWREQLAERAKAMEMAE